MGTNPQVSGTYTAGAGRPTRLADLQIDDTNSVNNSGQIVVATAAGSTAAPGVTRIQDGASAALAALASNADMVAATQLLGVESLLAAWDQGFTGSSVRLVNARSVSAGDPGSRLLPTNPANFNGTTYDPQLNNTQGTLLASAARTATVPTAFQTNYNARGLILFLNVTAASGTGGLVVRLVTNDGGPSGQGAYIVAAPPAIIAIGQYTYIYYPGATATPAGGNSSAQQIVSAPVPRSYYVNVIAGDATSYTYSLGVSYII